MRRREFLTGVMTAAGTLRRAVAAVPFFVLPAGDSGRLKLEFNTARSRVRLLFSLSPT